MIRSTLSAVLAVSSLGFVGCTNSEDTSPPAAHATGELMPVPSPAPDREVLADQSQVKVAVAREAPSYEPLEAFRRPRAEVRIDYKSPDELIAEVTQPRETSPSVAGTAGDASSEDEGFWKRVGVKALYGPDAVEPAERPRPGEDEDRSAPRDPEDDVELEDLEDEPEAFDEYAADEDAADDDEDDDDWDDDEDDDFPDDDDWDEDEDDFDEDD